MGSEASAQRSIKTRRPRSVNKIMRATNDTRTPRGSSSTRINAREQPELRTRRSRRRTPARATPAATMSACLLGSINPGGLVEERKPMPPHRRFAARRPGGNLDPDEGQTCRRLAASLLPQQRRRPGEAPHRALGVHRAGDATGDDGAALRVPSGGAQTGPGCRRSPMQATAPRRSNRAEKGAFPALRNAPKVYPTAPDDLAPRPGRCKGPIADARVRNRVADLDRAHRHDFPVRRQRIFEDRADLRQFL